MESASETEDNSPRNENSEFMEVEQSGLTKGDPEELLNAVDKRAEFIFLRNMISHLGSNDKSATYPSDCYSFLSLHGPTTLYFWFGFMVFSFQMAFLVMMIVSVAWPKWSNTMVDDNPGSDHFSSFVPTDATPLVRATQFLALITSVIFVDASMMDIVNAVQTFPRSSVATSRDRVGCMKLSCILRFSQGFLAIVTSFVLVLTSWTVLEIILNFAALNFISALDELAFEFASSGKYGPRLEQEANRINELLLPVCMFRRYKHVRYWCTAVPLACILIGGLAWIVCLQETKVAWDTQIMRVQFADTEYQDYNGCYLLDSDAGKDFKRYSYVSSEHNQKHARFGFCIKDHQWYLYEDNQSDPCASEGLIHSSPTDTFDISTVFLENWFTSYGGMADLHFIGDDDEVIERNCGSHAGDGRCDDFFNIPFYDYDKGDCCSATCTHSDCDVGGLVNAFDSTNTTGEGYSKCIDPTMINITIRLNSFMSNRNPEVFKFSKENLTHVEQFRSDFWNETPHDTLLQLYCDENKVLKFYISPSMANQSETVQVSDGANCEIYIENTTSSNPQQNDPPIWYVNYTVYSGDKEAIENLPILILDENSYDNGRTSFDIVPKCYAEKLLHNLDLMTVYNNVDDPSGKAIHRLIDEEEHRSEACQSYLLARYALFVLNFAAPNLESESLWIKKGPLCAFPNVMCTEDLLTGLDNLQLDVSGLGLSGYIATEIGMLYNLLRYDATNNVLTGSIPSEIGLLTGLSSLGLTENDLSGTIPTEIGLSRSLKYLHICFNSLTGSIPSEIGLLTDLMDLHADENNLTGSIPSEIGLLTSLTYLSIATNRLSGSVPSEIGLLTNLKIIEIHENALTGTIPTEMEGLIVLEKLKMGSNYIEEDSIPSSLATKVVEECIICGGIGSYKYIDGNIFNGIDDSCLTEDLQAWTPESMSVDQCDLLNRCVVCNGTEEINGITEDLAGV